MFAGLFAVLLAASMIGAWLASRQQPNAAVANLNARIRAWWVMVLVGGAALLLGRVAVVVLFGLLSWFALSEFLSQRRWWLFVSVPVQFAAAGWGWWWGAALLIPLACLFVPSWEQRAGLLLCVYGLSWAVALPQLEWVLYFVLVVQASDVLQYLWGRAIGRHSLAPRVSPAKTVEGLVGGIATATTLGAMLHSMTPFSTGSAALVSFVMTAAGFMSGLIFSAMKRRRGIKDWGTAITGHGGVLDRVDSLCLASPVFFVAVRWFGSR